MSELVVLTNREIDMAAHCGVMRNIAAIVDKREARIPSDEAHWNSHVEGALGEVAVAKVLGRYWSPSCNVFRAPDIGRNIGVRTRSKHTYDLIVRPDDDPDCYYVLVTGIAPEYRVHGYMRGHEARRDAWWKDYGDKQLPAWFVPQSALYDINDLRREP